jgi:hypothetical protein
MADTWATPTEDRTGGHAAAHQETIALLEEEIARLEGELRLRDLEAAERDENHPVPPPVVEDAEARERIIELGDALAAREETIALLLEQVRLADEAEAASHAEWEQLHQWVQEVERRVAESGDGGTNLRNELAAERRSTEALRQAAEKDQRAWEVQRQALVAEVERLRARFAEVAGESGSSGAAVQALERENQELRDAYGALARSAVPAHEVDALVQELETLKRQHEAQGQELQRLRDDHQRQRNEYEASLNAMRTQLARESLRRQEEHVKTSVAQDAPQDKETLLEADMRIRALREHLKEIHQDETDQKMRRSLAARLSRLWHHTSQNR